jgi:hypothetical protein
VPQREITKQTVEPAPRSAYEALLDPANADQQVFRLVRDRFNADTARVLLDRKVVSTAVRIRDLSEVQLWLLASDLRRLEELNGGES